MLRSPGQPISSDELPGLQNTFRADLSGVREHHGPQAREAAALMRAEAFTVGRHIVYGGPVTDAVRAHELTHTVAPVEQAAHQLGGGLGVTDPGHAGERLAAENGRRVAAGGTSLVTGGLAQRQEDGTVQRAPKVSSSKSASTSTPTVGAKRGRKDRSETPEEDKPKAPTRRSGRNAQPELGPLTLTFGSSYAGVDPQRLDRAQNILFDQSAVLHQDGTDLPLAQTYDFTQYVTDRFESKFTNPEGELVQDKVQRRSWVRDGPYRPPYDANNPQLTVNRNSILFKDEPGFSTDRSIQQGQWLDKYEVSFRWAVQEKTGRRRTWDSDTVTHTVTSEKVDDQNEAPIVHQAAGTGGSPWTVDFG
ncbi:DUF4157 domain-containing protein [Actinoplanes sp. NPDC051494]|uniref:DUF4157 domain-containing protein n=1 Tax=Actinoplanes sp. NPDC051494 TaxID=3363907 RepID=UPI0037B00A63